LAIRSNSARERILGCAEAIILQKGFTATSIDDILEKAAITKGGFFYHFDGRTGLAEALIERYLIQDDAIFNKLMEKADALTEDPLHQLLIFLKLLSEMMAEMNETHPGCLVASFTYESLQFKDNIREMMQTGLLTWRNMILARMVLINEQCPNNSDVSLETLADMFSAIVEGGILLARNFQDNQLLVDQIMAYRAFLRMAFGAK
jgi:TetR/AcrR family transcriptional repressor of nem operon